jgi:hypothetical protein
VSQAVVLVNATPQAQILQRSGVQKQTLQSASRAGHLKRSGGAHLEIQGPTGTFTVPARTTAVFIAPCFGN